MVISDGWADGNFRVRALWKNAMWVAVALQLEPNTSGTTGRSKGNGERETSISRWRQLREGGWIGSMTAVEAAQWCGNKDYKARITRYSLLAAEVLWEPRTQGVTRVGWWKTMVQHIHNGHQLWSNHACMTPSFLRICHA